MGCKVDEATFARYVQEAIGHLYDHFYLLTHPLAALLASSAPPEARGRALSAVLVEAIESLKPSPESPEGSLPWRKYRYLALRYIESLDPERVAARLGVSDRQARRDHVQGLNALVSLLWAKYRSGRVGDSLQTLAPGPEEGALHPSSTFDLAEEAERLGRQAPRETVPFLPILLGVVATTERLAVMKGRQISTDIDPDLPPIVVNDAIIRQALIGLVTNALESSSGGDVWLRCFASGVEVVVQIDYQATARQGGTGLLQVAQHLARSQGASIWQASSGNQVRLQLRLPAHRRPKVLVVDDNPDVSLLFRRYLGEAYRLVQATNWHEALRLAQTESPNAITLDVMMPGVDGWQLLTRLQNETSTAAIPVVVCSVLPEPSLALALGAAAFLSKPVNAQALRAVLDRLCTVTQPERPDWPSSNVEDRHIRGH